MPSCWTGAQANARPQHVEKYIVLPGWSSTPRSAERIGASDQERHETQVGSVDRYKPNSITLASSELAPNMFGAGSKLKVGLLSSLLAAN